IARVSVFIFLKQLDKLVETHLVLWNETPNGGGVRGVKRRKTGVATEYAENSDPLVRSDRGALPLDGVAGAGDRGRKANAVLCVRTVVILFFGNPNIFDAELVELGRVAERIAPAEDDKVFDPERREVRQYLPGDIPGLGGIAALCT